MGPSNCKYCGPICLIELYPKAPKPEGPLVARVRV